MPGDGKAEAGSGSVFHCPACAKAFKNTGQVFRGNPRSVVCDGKGWFAVLLEQTHRDCFVRRGKFYGIVHHNKQHLTESAIIAGKGEFLRAALQVQDDALGFRQPSCAAPDVLCQLTKLQRRLFNPEIGILQPGQFQKVIDQAL